MKSQPGIYVEITIHDELEKIWRFTQTPELHQRWDLRFTEIQYLPRTNPDAPQQFLYATRVAFGLAIRGTGESVGRRTLPNGESTSALRFDSDDPKSLIRTGSGYWRYVPTSAGIRFFTWYDYRVRFGIPGKLIDEFAFRPLMGWATAWSFDRMRLWVEDGQTPETSLQLFVIHAAARIAIAAIWLWHGLIPKLIYKNIDERSMLADANIPHTFLPFIGGCEVLLGILFLFGWKLRPMFLLNIVLMLGATIAVAAKSPRFLSAAFNPVSLNAAVIALSVVAWIASSKLPSASRCLRKDPKESR